MEVLNYNERLDMIRRQGFNIACTRIVYQMNDIWHAVSRRSSAKAVLYPSMSDLMIKVMFSIETYLSLTRYTKVGEAPRRSGTLYGGTSSFYFRYSYASASLNVGIWNDWLFVLFCFHDAY